MEPLLQRRSVSEFAGALEETLRKAEQLGATWERTRFDKYLRLLKDACSWQYLLNLSGAEGDRLAERLWEAASQAQQLIRSAPVWDQVRRDVLIKKFEKVFSGAESPPVSGKDDEPRNTLLELLIAGLLKHSGFEVELSDQPDVLAALPGAEFVVECKRPGRIKRLEESLRSIRDQLIERHWQDPQRIGVAAIGIDRLIGIVGRSPHTRDLVSLRSFLEEKAEQVTQEIARLVPKTKLGTQARFGCVVLATTIFVESENVMTTAHQFSGFSLERGDRSPLANLFAERFGNIREID